MKAPILLTLITLCNMLFSQIPSYVPLNGLAAFYPFDGNTNDVSGNNNHAASSGTSLTVDRNLNINSAYSFNGANQFMSANLSTTLTADWTISGWYKVEGGDNFNAYYAFGLGFTPNANGFGFGGTAHACYPMQYGMYDGGNGTGCSANQSLHGSITPDYLQWIHLVLTKSGSTYTFYFNSVPDGNSNLLPMSIGKFFMGKRADNILFYKGIMDEIGIWNRVLTTNEIDSLYEGVNTVSVNEITLNSEILVYPNPAKDIINLKITDQLVNSEFEITDVIGQVVYKNKIKATEMVIHIPDFSKGVYFFNIKGINSKKIIIE